MNAAMIRRLYPIALAHLTIEVCNNYLPIVYPILIVTLGLNYAQIGFIALVSSAASTLTQPVFGHLSDRWGARRMVIGSIVWIGFVMALVGLTRSYWSLLVVVALGALGSAAFHPAGAVAAAYAATTRRGAMLSVFSAGGTVGSGLGPLLIAAVVGLVGLSGTLVLIPIALFMALLIYWQWDSEEKLEPPHAAVSKATAAGISIVQNGSAGVLALVIFIAMCRSWFHLSFVTYLPEWLQSQGWSLIRSGQMLTVMAVCIGVGALIGGALSDRVGRWQVIALSLGLLGPVFWIFMSSSGTIQTVLVSLIGILIGSSFPVTIAAAQEAWPQGIGLASALATGVGWLPGGIGASFTGMIADRTSLPASLHLLIIPPFIGLTCTLVYASYQRKMIERIELQSLSD